MRMAKISSARPVTITVVGVALLLLSGCNAVSGGAPAAQSAPSPVSITPQSATVRGGQTVQFSAKVTGNTNQSVRWMVNGVVGGDGTAGRIDSKGLFTAPVTLPSSNSANVAAQSSLDSTLTGSVSVALQSPIPDVVAVSPSALPIGNFTLTVSGKNFVKGSQVMFAGTALPTNLVNGQLVATGTSTQSQTGPVKVTVRNPDPGAITSTSSVTVQVGAAGKVKVTVSPVSAQISAGATLQFAYGIVGATQTSAVKWSVNGVLNGNTTVGTITNGGIYTAPNSLPNPNTISVTATSLEDTTATSTAAVTLVNPSPIVVSVLPTSIPVGDFTLVVTGSKFVNGAVVTFAGAFLPTTFVSANELTATGTATAAQTGTVQVTVINPAPGSLMSNQFPLIVGNPPNTLSATAAARFLEQSTWGVTPLSLSHLQSVGIQAFLNEQFSAPKSTYPAPGPKDDMSFVQKRFFTNTLTGQDQLRQRVAFALSQITVISARKITDPNGFVLWENMLQNDAFGNYSTLLNDVTLSPGMGHYLDMVQNDKPDPVAGTTPNENYAREVMQLFSIGLVQLNPDGTPQLDGSGVPIPTYTQDTIEGFAHVFTGWAYPTKAGSTPSFYNGEYYGGPMIPFDSHHDSGAKLLLNGVSLPAGGTTTGDLNAALQNIFTHPNVGPFISKQLIQHLVTSNPSPDYIARIATVFNDNGSGVRGDLKAVVTAILLDPEARRGDDPTQAQPQDGHLKEPVLFMTNLMRAMNVTSDGSSLSDYASNMKQEPMFPPSVFNFYHPGYLIQGTTLLGPEFEIFNTSTTIARTNFVDGLVHNCIGTGTATDTSDFVALAGNPGQMVDAMASIMLHGAMSPEMRNTVVTTVSAIPDNTRRATSALYLIGSSSQFQVEH
jgi:uncharacterized protein (DUF1800 family)